MWHRLTEWFRMKQRGEKRVAPYGHRGRVFVDKDTGDSSFTGKIKADTRGTVSIKAKVYRAATKTWEDLGEIAKGSF